MKKKYFSMAVEEKEANIYIYGDIVSWEWFESDVSSYTLAKEIEALPKDIETINVFINSYGGEVAEALAIYNALRRHRAKGKPIATVSPVLQLPWYSWPATNGSCPMLLC